MVRRMDMQENVLFWWRKCSGHARQRMRDELLQAGAIGHKRARQNVETNAGLEDGRIPAKEARNWRIAGQHEGLQGKNTEDCGTSPKRKKHGTERSVESRQREDVAGCIA